MKKLNKFFIATFFLCAFTFSGKTWAQDIVWKKNFGGSSNDAYNSVVAVTDGIVAVGYSWRKSFGNGDWVGVETKGDENGLGDAIIVKYDHDGNVVWEKNFGGRDTDEFRCVIEVSDGIVAVGNSSGRSFGSGDWEDVESQEFGNAMIVKYDHAGNIVWKKNYDGGDVFCSVVTVSNGIVAVGSTRGFGFGGQANIVKYDNDGHVLWEKVLSKGWEEHIYLSVTAVSDGIVAVGNTYTDVSGYGRHDAVIVKYDTDGNVVWDKYFGGNDFDVFESVTTVSDGIIAVGYSRDKSFGNGDWEDVMAISDYKDAIIVKYDHAGNVVWKKNFGENNAYYSVEASANSIVALGNTSLVKHDWTGNVLEKRDLSSGGSQDLTFVPDGIIAVGASPVSIPYTDEWTCFTGICSTDAIIVKYEIFAVKTLATTPETGLRIYPNPTTGQLTIENGQLTIEKVEIFDVHGRLQKSETIKSKTDITIDISHFPAGFYFLRADGKTAKIIKR